MRQVLSLLTVLLVLSGCLKKMENVTEETRDHVKDSVQAIRDTHNGQKFGTAYMAFITTDVPALKAAAGESMILLAEEDRLPKYVGMARPPEYDNLTRHSPNVSWVGTEAGVKDMANFAYALHVPSVTPSVIYTFFASCLNGLKYLQGAAFKPGFDPEEIRTKAKRGIPYCIGIFAARPLPTQDDVDQKEIPKETPKIAWPMTPREKKWKENLVKQGEKLIRGILSLDVFDNDQDFRDKTEHQIEVKMHNRLELADNDEDR
jgi:hypothetical protein